MVCGPGQHGGVWGYLDTDAGRHISPPARPRIRGEAARHQPPPAVKLKNARPGSSKDSVYQRARVRSIVLRADALRPAGHDRRQLTLDGGNDKPLAISTHPRSAQRRDPADQDPC